MTGEPIDIAHLRGWIGREETATDIVTASLAARFHATIGLPGTPPRDGEAAPRLIHFCLAQPAVPTEGLGPDGHPARGGFLPPVPLPRRMWAGSEIAFDGDLHVGEVVRRRSTIADVTVKHGRSGALCFVTVEHEISGEADVVARDRQTIVYRAPDSSAGVAPPVAVAPAPAGATSATVDPSPTLLFRYSALTFNSHRIHYDRDYATGEEGYAGLVVHGPLQATVLLHFAAQSRGGIAPDRFTFRSLSTLFDNEPMDLHGGDFADGTLPLWTARAAGPIAMQAEARWR